MKTVWVIEDGEYSDYRAVGVYSTRENAEMIQKLVGGDVSEWDLDPRVEDINAGRRPYHVIMLYDGTVERIMRREIDTYDIRDHELVLWKRTEAPAYRGKGIPDALNGTIWATDEQHAIKIANEKRTQWIAQGKWKP